MTWRDVSGLRIAALAWPLLLGGFAATTAPAAPPAVVDVADEGVRRLLASAAAQARVTRGYDPRYVVIAYPGGDVPPETGVCSDVLVRAFRHAGIDLQKEVHEDMRGAFAAYPARWGLRRPDPNIDHRRVANLQAYFARRGRSLPVADDAARYRPGDIVAWHLDARGTTHIGLVSEVWNERTRRFSIVHNIGDGTKIEDRLFDWKVVGHYRWFDRRR